jgi:uroporphyrinogen decarboxylase
VVKATKKESVLEAIDRGPAGVIPFDIFEGWMWPDIARRLMRRCNVGDFGGLQEALGVYCRWLTPYYIGPDWPPGARDRVASPHTRYSLNGCIWGLRPGLREHGLGAGGHPLGGAETRQEAFRHGWPSPDWFDYPRLLQEARECAEHFVVVGGFTPLFYLIGDLCGMEKALMDMSLNPEVVLALCEKIEEFYTGYFCRVAEVCGDSVDAIAFGDDFSSQQGMLMGPECWRTYFKPVWARLFDLAARNGYKVMFHSCGSLVEVIPDLIDAGLDILYPIQPRARSMEIGFLRREFGSSLSFYGGVDVQELLPFGTVRQIEKEVVRIARVFERQGGFILSTSHVIMEDVPEENALKLYEVIRDISRYL